MKLALPALQGQQVLVLGLGDSGLAMARWCARFGSTVTVWDSRENPPQREALGDTGRFVSGAVPMEGITLVLKSPGLAPHDARIAPALQAGVPVKGELGLFAEALAALKEQAQYAPKVLAITGTNGKTTTTCMTALLVERAGLRVGLAGNIGPTLLDTLWTALDNEPEPQPVAPRPPIELAEGEEPLPIEPPPPPGPVFAVLPEAWVLELSSFQLDGVEGFEPTAGAVLNLTQDHLDWHGDMAAYGAAKARIFGAEGLLVINRDDPLVEAMVPAPVFVKGSRGKPGRTHSRNVCRFGLNAPTQPGDFGLVEEGGMAWLVRARELDPPLKRAKNAEAEELSIQRLMPADALRVRGRHNAANALAALALATAAGCELAPMLHGLREYRGEPHRVEPVGRIEDVEFYDDSKGTNVGATVAAILGLGADRAPAKLVLILGGDGKGQDFSPLAEPLARYGRAAALIGRDAAQIEAAIANSGVPLQHHASLEAATRWCLEAAQAGDSVLLSPACASLDMFRNYAHRAEVFIATVQAMADEKGAPL